MSLRDSTVHSETGSPELDKDLIVVGLRVSDPVE
jgi:hypothetical protein